MRHTALSLIVSFVLFTPTTPAQKAGDVAILGATIGPVSGSGYVVDRSGTFVASIPVSSPFGALGAGTAAPDNDGIIFASPRSSLPVTHDLFKFNGTLTTVATMPAGFAPVATRVDQNGDPLVLVRSQTAAASGIYRVVSGALATVAAGLSAPYAFCEDIDSGHFIVTDSGGAVLVVSRTGTVIQTRPNVFPANTGLALHEEYPTGGLLAAAGSLLHYDVSTGTLTTVLPAVSGGYFTLDGDPINDGHYAAGGQGIDWLDRSLVRTQVQRFGLYAPLSVVTWGSRMLTGRARPTPGAAYPIVLSMAGEAFKPYRAAASFGTRPGIRTPAGTVHLNPDALFAVSVSVPSIFGGFSGSLNANGAAQLTVNMPNAAALRGVRFFVAAVSYDNGGIRRVSEPLGVTIE